jgi:hypothetical protein
MNDTLVSFRQVCTIILRQFPAEKLQPILTA